MYVSKPTPASVCLRLTYGFSVVLWSATAISVHAATVQYDIDTAHSSLTASAKFLNNTVTLVEQSAGSLTNVVGGQIKADLSGSVFTFNGTSSIDPPLHLNAPFQPPGSGQDNYGGKFTVPFFGYTGNMAARDLVLTIASGSASDSGPASGLVFQFLAGHLDIASNIPNGSGLFPLTGLSSANNSSTPFTSQTNGNIQTITIPIDITASFMVVNPNDSTLTLRGQITATRDLTAMLAGDFNLNGVVDAADYVVWRNNNGTQPGYDAWRANFGAIQSAAASSFTPLAVPESHGLFAILLGAVVVSQGRSRTAR